MLIVGAAVAPLNAEPRAGSEQVSQTLAGHRLTVLEARAPWLRVRSAADDYEGWVHRGYVLAAAAPDVARRFTRVRTSLGCVAREADGRYRALPFGAVLADDACVESGEALDTDALAARFPRTADAIARSALQFFQGAAYEWGGITPWGADCSGFVQAIFRLHGVRLPRDARQQVSMGSPVVDGAAALRAADLLFFSERPDRRITHVALALDAHRFAHLALGRGGYAVERVADTTDSYVRELMERLVEVRRVV
jgi:cell wall-associated NlpC family hydrolase